MSGEETATVKKNTEDETTPKGQKRLPGMTPKKIKEIQDAAEEVKELQDERLRIQEEEKKAREKLLEAMEANKVKRYPLDDDYVAEIEYTEKKAYVHKVRKGKERKKAADAE